jgi:hypothetical protein
MGKRRKNIRIKNWNIRDSSWVPTSLSMRDSPPATRPQTVSALLLEKLADRARTFFSQFEAAIEVTADNVLINGDPVYVRGEDTSSAIDRIGVHLYHAHLERVVEAELTARMPNTQTRLHPGGVGVWRGEQRLALIRPTHAVVDNATGPQINGNFFVSGEQHWEELRRRLDVSSAVTILFELPASASADQRTRALQASASIRDRRRRSFDRALVKIMSRTTAGRHITFSPIPTSGPIEAPFEFSGGEHTFVGALRLVTPEAVLALVTDSQPSEDELLISAWLYGLESFEYLTCAAERGDSEESVERPVVARPPTTEHDEPRGDESDESPGSTRRLRSNEPIKDPTILSRLPAGLTPTPSTLHALPLYVADYTRRLPAGQHHSEDARALAARVGITLKPTETWVSGYWRGAGDLATLEFTWTEPNGQTEPRQHAA